jgi:hypothetical protein
LKGTMKRKKRIFETRDEYRAWREAREARERELRERIALIEAELAEKKKPA